MDSKRLLDVDPDYELINQPTSKKFKAKEKNDLQKHEKAKEIIAKEFQIDLAERQKTLDVIQERLTKAKKMLHLVRYLVITSFYNNKEFENVSATDTALMDSKGTANNFDPQNRIHPAVKKIIGKTPLQFNMNESRTSRRASKKKNQSENVKQEGNDANLLTTTKCPDVNETNVTHRDVSKREDDLCVVNRCTADGATANRRGRQKMSYRLVIGNISKWMPAESNEDNSTHKWMVYVRGPKSCPDITHFVKKIRFFLHPSYKPHDVIEMKEAPFHLSRRGWGEFPLRAQLHFQCSANKPVNLIHNIKLDRTYTGRQTLGNETIIDLSLYYDNQQNDEKFVSAEINKSTITDTDNESYAINTKDFVDSKYYSTMVKNEITVEYDDLFTIKKEETVTNEEINVPFCTDVKIEDTSINYNDIPSCSYAIETKNSASVTSEHDYCSYTNIKLESFLEDYAEMHQEAKLFNEHSYCSVGHAENDISKQQENTQSCNKIVEYADGINLENDPIRVEEEMILEDFLNAPTKRHTQSANNVNAILKKFSIIKRNSYAPHSQSILKIVPKKRQVSLLKRIFQKKAKAITFNSDNNLIFLNNSKLSAWTQKNPVPSESNENKTAVNVIDKSKYKIDIPIDRFSNIVDAFSFLLKRLPIINSLANDSDYKCIYPFTAPSEEIFNEWNVGKKLCAEWSRAKTIKNILIENNMNDSGNVKTKEIVHYARSHCFSSCLDNVLRKKHHQSDTDNKPMQLNFDDFSDVIAVKTNLLLGQVKVKKNYSFVDVIYMDKEKDLDSALKKSETFEKDSETNSVSRENNFIQQAVAEIGITLQPEEIDAGVNCNAAEQVLLKSALCLAEDLIRNAYANRTANNGNGNRNGPILEATDIYKALLNKKFRIFFRRAFVLQHPLLK